jgi:hypothetical protein
MSFATILGGSNAPFAIPTGRSEGSIARLSVVFDGSASRIVTTNFWSFEPYFA